MNRPIGCCCSACTNQSSPFQEFCPCISLSVRHQPMLMAFPLMPCALSSKALVFVMESLQAWTVLLASLACSSPGTHEQPCMQVGHAQHRTIAAPTATVLAAPARF